MLILADYAGTRFDQITDLHYSTYRQTANAGNNLAISLQFNADYDLNDAAVGYQGRLVFEPYLGIGGNVPQGTWQTWDAKEGKWWGTKATVTRNGVSVANPCVQATPCSWAQVLAAFPNAGVHTVYGAVVLKAGSGWPGFRGNVDKLSIGVSGVATTYDFELAAPVTVPVVPDQMSFPDDSAYVVVSTVDSAFTYYRRQVELAFLPGTSDATKAALFAKYGATVVGGSVGASSYFLRMTDPGATEGEYVARLAALRAEPGVRSVSAADRSAPLVADSYPNDGPGMRRSNWLADTTAETWALRRIRAPEAWSCENGQYATSRVRVGVYEGYWNEAHPEFVNANVRSVWTGNLSGRPNYPSSADQLNFRFHGTAVAGTLAAPGDNGTGTTGVMWRSDLSVYHTYNNLYLARSAGLVETRRAIRLSAEHNDRVLNVSTHPLAVQDTSIQDIVNAAYDLKSIFEAHPGFLLVVSAGNDPLHPYTDFTPAQVEAFIPGGYLGPSTLRATLMRMARMFPELRDRFIVVSSSTSSGQRASHSYFIKNGGTDLFAPGEGVAVVGLSEPGQPISYQGEVALVDGTSVATPLVAGVAAMLFSMDPSLTAAEAKRFLMEGAQSYRTSPTSADSIAPTPIYSQVYELDAYGALRRLSNSRPGTPLCGVETRVVYGTSSSTVGIFRKAGGGTESAMVSTNGPLFSLSIAAGGRRLAVTGTGPLGADVAEVNLANGNWSAPHWLGLGPLTTRTYLEFDTLDVHTYVVSNPLNPHDVHTDSVTYRLFRADGTVVENHLEALLAVHGATMWGVEASAASPDGTWLALTSQWWSPSQFGRLVQLVPLTGSLGSVVLRSFTADQEGNVIEGELFGLSQVVFRPDSWSFWLARGDAFDTTAPDSLVRYDRTNAVGGWTSVAQKLIEAPLGEVTWLSDPNVLLTRGDPGTTCQLKLRASQAPDHYLTLNQGCVSGPIPKMFLKMHTPLEGIRAGRTVRPQ